MSDKPKPHALCGAKHTTYQPSREEWRCPKCGSEPRDGFILETFSDDIGSHEDCEALHIADELSCERCNRRISGTDFSQAAMEKANRVACPHCKGHGFL